MFTALDALELAHSRLILVVEEVLVVFLADRLQVVRLNIGFRLAYVLRIAVHPQSSDVV